MVVVEVVVVDVVVVDVVVVDVVVVDVVVVDVVVVDVVVVDVVVVDVVVVDVVVVEVVVVEEHCPSGGVQVSPEQQLPRTVKVVMSMHCVPEARHDPVVVVEVVVVDVVVVDVVAVDVVVVDVVVVVSGAGHGSKRPKPNNPPQGAAVVVVVVVPHTSLATSEQVWEPHENLHSNNDLPITFSQILCNLNSPQVTSQVWEQSWPLHWSTHAALGSVKRQHTALK